MTRRTLLGTRLRLLPVMALPALAAGLFCGEATAQAQAPGKGLVVVLIGPPNSGKTTQAEFFQKKYHVPVVSIDRMRGSDDDTVNAKVRTRVEEFKAAKGFVLDGYPANREQANALAGLVNDLRLPAPVVVQIEISDAVAREREQKKSKPDLARVNRDLAEYHADMEFYRSYYPQANVWTINGDRDPKAVWATIEALVRDRSE